ncbi:hypothetical protein EC973_007499 [Apophysomyces ossiformis]|uniref:Uncharacterized protein n=1 Tax=Apophysomyces ossiformis TaxID=679940 RepID=A0A8H7BP40_9FUNG|nr:hypothetical protein EC973_007499 [Apophysomyces ossiformis]
MKPAYLVLIVLPTLLADTPRTLVVLMMENHSYDHFMGYFSRINPATDGSNPTMCNRMGSNKYCVSHDGLFHTEEPENFIPDVDQQLFNSEYGVQPHKNATPNMQGFVSNYAMYRGEKKASEIMRGMNETTMPVLYTLAQEFAISDRWFSSVPGNLHIYQKQNGSSNSDWVTYKTLVLGSTYPNRNFLHAATSGGVVTNDFPSLGYPLTTTFEMLDRIHVGYGVYSASPIPSTVLFRYFRSPFRSPDARNGRLPSYTYVEPAMFGVDQRLRNDQHPHAGKFYDIRRGEQFYKQVYEALRIWDEHGGFFDHVAPPSGVPNPDNITHPTFDFTRLGVRVPAILVSPRIPKGLVIPSSEIFEHASVPSTLHALFGMPYLTLRDQYATPFHTYANLTTPRTDCVSKLPEPAWNLD